MVKGKYGATVVRRDQENQCLSMCFRARLPDLDLIFELPYGPAAIIQLQSRPDR